MRRKKAHKLRATGMTVKAIADELKAGLRTVKRYLAQRIAEGAKSVSIRIGAPSWASSFVDFFEKNRENFAQKTEPPYRARAA